MRGRIPAPTKLVALRGGPDLTHRPLNDREPLPPEKIPPCPNHLNKLAKEEWGRISAVLHSVGLLTEADMAILAAYCDAYSRWVKAMNNVNKRGIVVSMPVYNRHGNKSGSIPKRNPYLDEAHTAFEQMIRAGNFLGLSPSSRSTMKVSKEKPRSRVEEFMSRKNGKKETG